MSSVFSGDEMAPFFGLLGATAALILSCMGAAYGTAKSGVGVEIPSQCVSTGLSNLWLRMAYPGSPPTSTSTPLFW